MTPQLAQWIDCCGFLVGGFLTVFVVIYLARIARGGGPPDPGW